MRRSIINKTFLNTLTQFKVYRLKHLLLEPTSSGGKYWVPYPLLDVQIKAPRLNNYRPFITSAN